jgi:predicted phage gp36 major capsid-like protein
VKSRRLTEKETTTTRRTRDVVASRERERERERKEKRDKQSGASLSTKVQRFRARLQCRHNKEITDNSQRRCKQGCTTSNRWRQRGEISISSTPLPKSHITQCRNVGGFTQVPGDLRDISKDAGRETSLNLWRVVVRSHECHRENYQYETPSPHKNVGCWSHRFTQIPR